MTKNQAQGGAMKMVFVRYLLVSIAALVLAIMIAQSGAVD
jgi:hypothetical protein